MTAVTFLGTAPGQPVSGRGHAALLLQRDDNRILVDAGEPCATRLSELGVPLATISDVLITHAHADHVGGLPMFIQSCFLAGRKTPLYVWTPRSLTMVLRQWLEVLFLTPELVGFQIVFHTWEEAERHQCGAWKVRAFETTHLELYRPQIPETAGPTLRAYGFVLAVGDLRVVHSGDLGALSDLDGPLSKPTSLTICEATHMSDVELFDFLRKHPDHRFVLTHFGLARLEKFDEFKERVRAACPSTSIEFAEDGMTMRVDQLSAPEYRRRP